MSELSAAILEPVMRFEDLERLEIVDEAGQWEQLHQVIQGVLESLDEPVRAAVEHVTVRHGCNRGRSWDLFSYRVYEQAQSGVDAVVVGVTVNSEQTNERMRLQGDIAGETTGDVLFEASPSDVMGQAAAQAAAHRIAQTLVRRADAVIAALNDVSRQA